MRDWIKDFREDYILKRYAIPLDWKEASKQALSFAEVLCAGNDLRRKMTFVASTQVGFPFRNSSPFIILVHMYALPHTLQVFMHAIGEVTFHVVAVLFQ